MEHIYSTKTGLEIAVIGISGKFPQSNSIDEFWQNLVQGKELISQFNQEETKAGAILDNIDLFDAAFFGFNPREAANMDPQHRLFLECAWGALENAGYDSKQEERPIGVFTGVGVSTYLLYNLFPNQDLMQSVGTLQSLIGTDKDYLPTRLSYKLNLTGPSVSVQTACSSSLVAVHMACQSLLSGECDIALAGGVSIKTPQNAETLSPGGIISPDGHCRAFDAKANGTLGGNGVGVVVLKRLEDAVADRDYIYAVVKGSAINNDGALKVGYTAPSQDGQAKVIRAAQVMGEVEPETITYMEAHGTGTPLGDPIEVAAMTQAFRVNTDKKGYCAIGSVKTNVGHLDAAAGIAGFIKTVLALHHKLIPPSLNFETPNPQIDFENSPFYVNNRLSDWKNEGISRRAGVSSFGFGGTNAHVILEEAPTVAESNPVETPQLLLLSAKTSSALEIKTANLVKYLKSNPQLNLADVAYTLQIGRREFEHRRMVVGTDLQDALIVLESNEPQRVFSQYQQTSEPPVIFMFAGQGAQYVNMARELYETGEIFKQECDRLFDLLKPHLEFDLRSCLFPEDAEVEIATQQLQQTAVTQPALFVIEYALAKLWMSWGIHPRGMIGHSIGEYVAACLAGVFSLEDALALVAARGKLMQQAESGKMLSVGLSVEEVESFLGKNLSVAAVNSPCLCVVSGTTEAIEQLEKLLQENQINCRSLHTNHAFHSPMMDSIVEPFLQLVKQVKLNPPKIPFISNVTGTWIAPGEATAPIYWARHLRQPVQFAPGIAELIKDSQAVFLEVAPGRTLSTLVKQQVPGRVILSSLRHPKEEQKDVTLLLNTLGKLWLAGISVNWSGFYENKKASRIPLPTYPFERQRYWIEASNKSINNHQLTLDKKPDIADWFSVPSWKRSFKQLTSLIKNKKHYFVIFVDEIGLGDALSDRLINEWEQQVIKVKIGEYFCQINDNTFSINPGIATDYEKLFKELIKLEQIPILVHCWSVNPYQSWEKYQKLGFWSLLYLAQAIGNQNFIHPLQIKVISSNIQEVIGNEIIFPEKAVILGACNVIPQEYPNISFQNIDIASSELINSLSSELQNQLVTEILADSSDIILAYRNNHRWVQTFEPVKLANTSNQTSLREEGVYLITGGIGDIGLAIAEYLAQTVKAKLALVGRSQFPDKSEWKQWLDSHNDEDTCSQKIRKLQTIENLGAEVLILSADVANYEQMHSAVNQIYENFGQINGVIHAAGVRGLSEIQLKTPEMTESVFAAKVQGTLVIDKIFKECKLDFLILWSSISSFVGGFLQVDYSGASAFIDRFSHCTHQKTIVINWDTWQEVGMALMIPSLPSELQQRHNEAVKKGMFLHEGIEAFSRIISSQIDRVIVTTRDVEEIIAEYDLRRSKYEQTISQVAASKEIYPRPDLSTTYVAPRNKIEQQIAEIWQELLGIEKIGIYDDFFEFGGHSLLATQFTSRLREIFQIQISLQEIFDAKTIAEISQKIEAVNTNNSNTIKAVSRQAYRVNL